MADAAQLRTQPIPHAALPRQVGPCRDCAAEALLYPTFISGEGWRDLCWACGETAPHPKVTRAPAAKCRSGATR